MREIPVTRGLVALVDDEDYDAVVALGKWHAEPSRHTFYARKRVKIDGKRPSIWMHSLIVGSYGFDHINGDGLDNRRSNLRPATPSQNKQNQRMRADNKSGYRGVFWNRGWYAAIRADGIQHYLGVFPTPVDAARAYDIAARQFHGEFARPNFPLEIAS